MSRHRYRKCAAPSAVRRDDPRAVREILGAAAEDPSAEAVLGFIDRERRPSSQAMMRRYELQYAEDMAAFGLPPFPAAPADLIAYFERWRGKLAYNTIDQYVRIVSYAHLRRGLEDPTKLPVVRAHVQSLLRDAKGRPHLIKPIPIDDYKKLRGSIPLDFRGRRDRLMFGLMYEGALKAQEVAGLDVGDVEAVDEGLIVRIRANSRPRTIAIRRYGPSDVYSDFEAWMEYAQLKSGPLIRGVDRHQRLSPLRLSETVIRNILHNRVDDAGLEKSAYGTRSFRAGFMVEALRRGMSPLALVKHAGYTSQASLLPFLKSLRGAPLSELPGAK